MPWYSMAQAEAAHAKHPQGRLMGRARFGQRLQHGGGLGEAPGPVGGLGGRNAIIRDSHATNLRPSRAVQKLPRMQTIVAGTRLYPRRLPASDARHQTYRVRAIPKCYK